MDALDFARNGLCALLGMFGYAGAVLIALYALGFIFHVLALMITGGEDEDDD